MHICKYRSVNRRFDAVAEAVSPKPVFEIVNDNPWAEFCLRLWSIGVYLVSGIGPLGQGDNLVGGVEHTYYYEFTV
jgi:hypothetical protein